MGKVFQAACPTKSLPNGLYYRYLKKDRFQEGGGGVFCFDFFPVGVQEIAQIRTMISLHGGVAGPVPPTP